MKIPGCPGASKSPFLQLKTRSFRGKQSRFSIAGFPMKRKCLSGALQKQRGCFSDRRDYDRRVGGTRGLRRNPDRILQKFSGQDFGTGFSG